MVPEVGKQTLAGGGAAIRRVTPAGVARSIGSSVSRHAVLRAACRQFAYALPLLLVVSALNFIFLALLPGDATTSSSLSGGGGIPTGQGGALVTEGPTVAQYARLRHAFHLDQPLYTQYVDWLKAALHGDLGTSLLSSQSVTGEIVRRLPITASLVLLSLLVSAILGVGLGVVGAVRRGAIGRVVDVIAVAGWAFPAFWIAAELIVLFSVKLRWLPAVGYVAFTQSPVEWLRSLALPVTALALGGMAGIAKVTREAMLDALSSEYIRMSYANGASLRSIVFCHALKNASIKVTTIIGLLAVGLIGGTVFVEQVFAIPGLGSMLVNGAGQRDVPVVQGVVVVFTLLVVTTNFLTDIAYSLIDPRVGAQ